MREVRGLGVFPGPLLSRSRGQEIFSMGTKFRPPFMGRRFATPSEPNIAPKGVEISAPPGESPNLESAKLRTVATREIFPTLPCLCDIAPIASHLIALSSEVIFDPAAPDERTYF